jgi:beta-glucanase (GH16 family)
MNVKLPLHQGIGTSGWLYNNYPFYNEIDMWETYGEPKNQIACSYHYQKNSTTFTPNAPRHSNSERIYLKDQNTKQPIDLSTSFNKFGVYCTHDSIVWYLNGQPIKTLNLKDHPVCNYNQWLKCITSPNCNCANEYAIPNNKFFIRIGIGIPLGPWQEPNQLPQTLAVDYIKVWLPQKPKQRNTNSSIHQIATDIPKRSN